MQRGAAEEKFPLVIFNSVTGKWELWYKIIFFYFQILEHSILKSIKVNFLIISSLPNIPIFFLETQEKKGPLVFKSPEFS